MTEKYTANFKFWPTDSEVILKKRKKRKGVKQENGTKCLRQKM